MRTLPGQGRGEDGEAAGDGAGPAGSGQASARDHHGEGGPGQRQCRSCADASAQPRSRQDELRHAVGRARRGAGRDAAHPDVQARRPGRRGIAWAATAPELACHPGALYLRGKQLTLKGAATDPSLAAQIWRISKQQTGIDPARSAVAAVSAAAGPDA